MAADARAPTAEIRQAQTAQPAPGASDEGESVGSTAYDPETETDSLIRQHIELNPRTGEATFRGLHYPVWAVVLNLLATDRDCARVRWLFKELPDGAVEAAERFWQLHGDDIRDRVG